MDDRIETLTGCVGLDPCSCALCGNEIRELDTSFAARPKGRVCLDYCSMACARKALGIEPTFADCQKWVAANMSSAVCMMCCNKPACANYEPEAEPFGHTNCPCLATEPEAEVWEWERLERKAWVLKTKGRDTYIVVHKPTAKSGLTEADRDLIAQAPQTAANLAKAEAEAAMYRNLAATLQEEGDRLEARVEAAEAEIVRLTRFGRKVETQNAEVRDDNAHWRKANARLQSELDAMHGKRFSSRAYYALKSRAEDADEARSENAALRAEIDANEDKAQAMFEALKSTRTGIHMALWAVRSCSNQEARDYMLLALEQADAALGQDGAK